MPFGIQPLHLVLIAIVALILVGPKRLPDIGRWIVRTLIEFRQGAQGLTESIREESAAMAFSNHNSKTTGSTHSYPISHPAVEPSQLREALGILNSCTKCGSTNPPEAVFCSKCGNPLSP